MLSRLDIDLGVLEGTPDGAIMQEIDENLHRLRQVRDTTTCFILKQVVRRAIVVYRKRRACIIKRILNLE